MANELAISANPMRLAQFGYNLLASAVAGVIPLSIRMAKNPSDVSARREMLAMFTNKLYQARDAYYASITLGMVQVRCHATGDATIRCLHVFHSRCIVRRAATGSPS